MVWVLPAPNEAAMSAHFFVSITSPDGGRFIQFKQLGCGLVFDCFPPFAGFELELLSLFHHGFRLIPSHTYLTCTVLHMDGSGP